MWTEQGKQTIANRIAATKERFLENYVLSLGVLTEACRRTGITRQTVHGWAKSDEAFRLRMLESRDTALDFVEDKMFERIGDGDSKLIQFYLETKGKERGYIRKTELTPPQQEQPVTIAEWEEKKKIRSGQVAEMMENFTRDE